MNIFLFQRMLHLVDFSLKTAPRSGSRPAGPEFESIGGERTGCGSQFFNPLIVWTEFFRWTRLYSVRNVVHPEMMKTETKLESPSARERQAAATAPCFHVQCSERSHDRLGLPLKCAG